jgi:hypothetical protein
VVRAADRYNAQDACCDCLRGPRGVPRRPRAGEISEFKAELNSLDRGKKKDAVKKVIAGAH